MDSIESQVRSILNESEEQQIIRLLKVVLVLTKEIASLRSRLDRAESNIVILDHDGDIRNYY